jgi:hypothetical protein
MAWEAGSHAAPPHPAVVRLAPPTLYLGKALKFDLYVPAVIRNTKIHGRGGALCSLTCRRATSASMAARSANGLVFAAQRHPGDGGAAASDLVFSPRPGQEKTKALRCFKHRAGLAVRLSKLPNKASCSPPAWPSPSTRQSTQAHRGPAGSLSRSLAIFLSLWTPTASKPSHSSRRCDEVSTAAEGWRRVALAAG